MRSVVVPTAVVLAFAAGWLLRGCADDGAPRSGTTSPTPLPVVAPPAPVHRPRTTSRGDDGSKSEPRVDQPDAESDGRAKDAVAPTPPSEAPPTPAAVDVKAIKSVSGVVVDRMSGEPVAGVMIHLCASNDDGGLGWNGSGTDDEGRFKADVLHDWLDGPGLRLEVVAGRDGYRPARVPVTTAVVRVEIEKLDHAPRAGRIVGTARDEAGKPITGRLFVGLGDDLDLHSFGVWTNADANGRFAIDGVVPGHWTVSLAESRESFEVNVVEDGEASVDLRGKFEDATGAFAAGELTAASYARQKARFDAIVAAALRDVEGDDEAAWKKAWDNPVVREASWSAQQLEYQWIRYAPGRDVVVSGATSAGGAFVRLDHRGGAGCEWRAAIVDGAARFPSIPYGKWRAVLVRPGVADATVDVDVKAGDGPLVVVMNRSK